MTGLTESKTLQMIFLNANNARVTISVAEPKDDLTSTEVEEAMDRLSIKILLTLPEVI